VLRLGAERFQLMLNLFERVFIACNQADTVACSREALRDRTAYAGRGTGNDDGAGFMVLIGHGLNLNPANDLAGRWFQ
jgi:hypothetical protein